MNEETPRPDSNIKSAIDAATGLAKAIPVYQDTLQPAAKEIGKSIETVAKTVNIALAPIKALVWGYEKIEEFINTTVSKKLRNVSPENITTPLLQIAGPAVEALRYVGHDENLRELFANLLATSMDKTSLHKSHPGYVDIIKNISSDEASLLKAFLKKDIYPVIHLNKKAKENAKGHELILSNYSHLYKITKIDRVDLMSSYIDNLCRLGILEVPQYLHLTEPDTYEPLENDELWHSVKETAEKSNVKLIFDRAVIRLTSYGKQFVESVVKEKE